MAFEDIERLKDKVSRDPNSKLFIPLAEEYTKAGMFDDAIEVLTKGLERQPDYMSARVSLGKVYIMQGMLEEAKGEFEKVVGSIPDNLYAHKRLAEIYRDLGEKDKAIKEFKTVLKLNPMDDWAATNITDIQAGPKPVPEEEKAEEMQEPPDVISDITKEGPSEFSDLEEALGEIEVIPAQAGEEALDELEEVFFEKEEEALEELGELSPETGEETVEPIEEMIPEIVEETMQEGPPVSQAEEETLEAGEEGMDVTEEIPLEGLPTFEEVYKPSEAVFGEEEAGIKEEISEERPLSVYDADTFIVQNKFIEAMRVYRTILSQEPGNKQVIQRVEELKALLKLLGKDTEDLISRLNLLQEYFNKRRDEFRRRT